MLSRSTIKHHALLLVVGCIAIASAKAGKPHPTHRPAPAPATQPLAPGALPSSVLQPFLDTRLNTILAPLGSTSLKHPEAVAEIRSAIADGMSKAPAARHPAFQAAIEVCNVLSQALDERTRANANLEGSERYSGYPGTKHVTAREAAVNNAFFANTQKTQWAQRSAQLRQQIEKLFAREREIERQVSTTPPVAAAGETITIQKPTTIRMKYGTVTLPSGTVLHVIKRDSSGVVVDYSGEAVTLPPE